MAGEGLDEGAFAAAGGPVKEVAAAVGDAAVVVPFCASEEIGDVGEDAFFDAFVEDDGFQRALSTGFAEFLPARAARGVDDGLALCGLLSQFVRFGEERFEDVTLGVERCKGDGFPGLAHLEIHGFGFTHAIDREKGIFVA